MYKQRLQTILVLLMLLAVPASYAVAQTQSDQQQGHHWNHNQAQHFDHPDHVRDHDRDRDHGRREHERDRDHGRREHGRRGHEHRQS